jgi:AraC family transcriptional regulator
VTTHVAGLAGYSAIGAGPIEASGVRVTGAAATRYACRPGGLARWQAMRVIAYIDENLGSKLDIHELADLVALSSSHFSRAFRRSLGLPPMAYVASRRVERAKLMITSTREQLIAIATACGFADQSHLNKSFRRSVGVSPGMWRRLSA